MVLFRTFFKDIVNIPYRMSEIDFSTLISAYEKFRILKRECETQIESVERQNEGGKKQRLCDKDGSIRRSEMMHIDRLLMRDGISYTHTSNEISLSQ